MFIFGSWEFLEQLCDLWGCWLALGFGLHFLSYFVILNSLGVFVLLNPDTVLIQGQEQPAIKPEVDSQLWRPLLQICINVLQEVA